MAIIRAKVAVEPRSPIAIAVYLACLFAGLPAAFPFAVQPAFPWQMFIYTEARPSWRPRQSGSCIASTPYEDRQTMSSRRCHPRGERSAGRLVARQRGRRWGSLAPR
jgi:hypothetical protein